MLDEALPGQVPEARVAAALALLEEQDERVIKTTSTRTLRDAALPESPTEQCGEPLVRLPSHTPSTSEGSRRDSTRGAGGDPVASSSSAFNKLLDQLQVEHAREVAELSKQIAELKGPEAVVPAMQAPAPRDSHFSEPPNDLASGLAGTLPSEMSPASSVLRSKYRSDTRTSTTNFLGRCTDDFEQTWTLGSEMAILVTMVGAKNLRRADWGPGRSSDPYVTLSTSGDEKIQIQSQVINNNRNPVWNYKAAVVDYTVGDDLAFCVYDYDWGSSGELLGKATLSYEMMRNGHFESELELEETRHGSPSYLSIKVQPLQVAKDSARVQQHKFRQVWQRPPQEVATLTQECASQLTKEFAASFGGGDERMTGLHSKKKTCSQRVIFHPGAGGRILWEIMGVFLLVIDLIWMPMSAYDPPEMIVIKTVEWMTLFYWTLDIFATFNTGYYDSQGALVIKRRAILIHYFRTWMLFDVLLVSLDWAMVLEKLMSDDSDADVPDPAMARSARLARITRIVRLLRMMRLAKLRALILTIEGLIDSEYITVVFAVAKNLGVLLATTHVLACVFFAIGASGGDDPSNSWVAKLGIGNMDFGDQYLISLQWSLAQFTPGASPVQPQSTGERIMSVSVLAIGLVMATCFVSSITSTMASLWQMQRYNTVQSLLLKKFLVQHKIARSLTSRITRYVDFAMESRRKRVHQGKVDFLKLLSEPLFGELQIQMFKRPLSLFPCFLQYEQAHLAAMRQLCSSALAARNYTRGDMVFETGAEAKDIYVATHGTLVYNYYLGDEGAPRKESVPIDKWFAEAALWTEWRHRGDIKGVTEVDAIVMSVAQFCSITASCPKAYVVTRLYALHFLRELLDNGDNLTDLPLDLKTGTGAKGRIALSRVVWVSGEEAEEGGEEQEASGEEGEETRVQHSRSPSLQDAESHDGSKGWLGKH